MNKKIKTEIAVGVILIISIILGAVILCANKKHADTQILENDYVKNTYSDDKKIKELIPFANSYNIKNVLLNNKSGFIIETRNGQFKQVNDKLEENDSENVYWDDIRVKEKNILAKFGINDGTHFKPSLCNQLGNNKFIYLETFWMYDNDQRVLFILARYDKTKRQITTLLKFDDYATRQNKLFEADPFSPFCDDYHYISYIPQKGFFDYDFKNNRNIMIDGNNYQETKEEYDTTNFSPLSINGKKYFKAQNNWLGVFDSANMKFGHLDINLNDIINENLKTDYIRLLDAENTTYIFLNGEKPEFLYIYNSMMQNWKIIKLGESKLNEVLAAKILGNSIFVVIEGGLNNNTGYLIDKKDYKIIQKINNISTPINHLTFSIFPVDQGILINDAGKSVVYKFESQLKSTQ